MAADGEPGTETAVCHNIDEDVVIRRHNYTQIHEHTRYVSHRMPTRPAHSDVLELSVLYFAVQQFCACAREEHAPIAAPASDGMSVEILDLPILHCDTRRAEIA